MDYYILTPDSVPAEPIPLQQGLKHGGLLKSSIVHGPAEPIPLQQGLKLCATVSEETPRANSRRADSTTTRIETLMTIIGRNSHIPPQSRFHYNKD